MEMFNGPGYCVKFSRSENADNYKTATYPRMYISHRDIVGVTANEGEDLLGTMFADAPYWGPRHTTGMYRKVEILYVATEEEWEKI